MCRLYRAFEQWCWACSACQQIKKQEGYDVTVGKTIDFACDFCGESANAKRGAA